MALKHHYCSPYQAEAEAINSSLFQWRGNVIRSYSLDRNFRGDVHFTPSQSLPYKVTAKKGKGKSVIHLPQSGSGGKHQKLSFSQMSTNYGGFSAQRGSTPQLMTTELINGKPKTARISVRSKKYLFIF